jgi:deoxyribodipyrimidine photo-lyase
MSHAPELLPKLATQYEIDTIFVTAEKAPEEQGDEKSVERNTTAQLTRVEQGSLLHSDDLPFAVKDTPEIFTQFRTVVEKSGRVRPILLEPKRWPQGLSGAPLSSPDLISDSGALHPLIPPGEAAGLARVHEYLWDKDRLRVYKETRNGMLEWDDSSKISPWLSMGALSPRSVYFEIKRYEEERIKNDSTYWLFFELLWRDYFRLILEKKQAQLFGQQQDLSEKQKSGFERWACAKTGDDFIDANMTELNQTGWLSNRGRQNVASFLAKEMEVPWQYGAQYFERLLIDYDVANNWGNWAYFSGAGQDPRNRRFKTKTQADHYDPQGTYRLKWLKR